MNIKHVLSSSQDVELRCGPRRPRPAGREAGVRPLSPRPHFPPERVSTNQESHGGQ